MEKNSQKRAITSADAPKPIGPYSPMVQNGNLFFISGQIGLSPTTGQLVEGIDAQMHQVMKNTLALLKTANLTFKNILQATIYVTDIGKFQLVNEIYGQYIPEPYPARAVVEVAKLPKGALIEISFTAGQ